MAFQPINPGERFGWLTVVERMRLNKLRQIEYLVRCDCAAILIVTRDGLENGVAFSCGCTQKRAAPKNPAEPSRFEYTVTSFRERRVPGKVQLISADGRVLDERPLTTKEIRANSTGHRAGKKKM